MTDDSRPTDSTPGSETGTAGPDRVDPDAGRVGGGAGVTARPTPLEQAGGIVGIVFSSIPILVFVVVNTVAGLTAAIWSAVGSAVLLAGVRLARKEPLQPALSGLFGVAIAAFIAHRTGDAKGFFLLGIWTSLIYGGVFLVSIVVRRPLVGVIWSLLNGADQGWRRDPRALRAYDIATLGWTVVFLARYVVQNWLYDADSTAWLAGARLAMGWPLAALALLLTAWAVRRADAATKVVVPDGQVASGGDATPPR